MSVHAATWARTQTAGSPGAKLVLLALADYADDEGRCWPSQATLAAVCEMGERTVRRQLDVLEAAGLLTRSRRNGPGGHRSSDLITLALPAKSTARPTGQSDRLEGETYRPNQPVGESPTGQKEQSLPAKNDRPTGQIGRVTVREPSLEPQEVVTTQGDHTSSAPTVDNSDPTRCPTHQHHPAPPPCDSCRRRREAHARAAAADRANAVRDQRRAQAQQRRAAIDACDQCDHDGRRTGTRSTHPIRCTHQPPGGRQRAEAALAAGQLHQRTA